jgi:PAS domain S-box-containing protein
MPEVEPASPLPGPDTVPSMPVSKEQSPASGGAPLPERSADHYDAALLRVMETLLRRDAPGPVIGAILAICKDAIGGDEALLVRDGVNGDGALTWAATQGATLLSLPEIAPFVSEPMRVDDLASSPWVLRMRQTATDYGSFLSVPVAVTDGPPLALFVLAAPKAAFSQHDLAFLHRVGGVLEVAFCRMGHGVDAAETAPLQDLPVAASGGVHGRIAEWHGKILDVTNALLDVGRDSAQAAITDALASTGSLAQSDRTYVFRLRDPGRLDNTHEWAAPGVEPMIDKLQDLPVEIMDEWKSRLEAGQAIEIPDVTALPPDSAVREVLLLQGIKSLHAVPMMRDGKLAGFVGYDAVRQHRSFLQLEIQLLKSVATAINMVMDRAAAEEAAEKARAGLQSERDRLQATLAVIPELVLELDVAGRFLSYNSGAQLVTALHPERLMGRLPEEVLSAPLCDLLRGLLGSVTESGGPRELDHEVDLDGERRSFFVTAAPRSHNGAQVGFVLVVRDITTRRRQQREHLRLSKIAELTSNLVIVGDAAGCIDWVNPAFERRTGWRLADVRGKTAESVLRAPGTDPVTLRRISAAIREGKAVQAEVLNQSRSGDEYWTTADVQPLHTAAGQIEGFVSVQTEITALKRSHQEALRDRAMAMDASIDGIAISDSRGQFTYMNQAHRRMFGIGPDEDIGNWRWQDFCPPDAAAAFVAEELPKLVTDGTWRGEYPGLSRTGDLLHNEVSLTLMDDGGLLCIARDIGPRVRADQELALLREELQLAQRQQTIAQITAGVAHDLNNIVAVVAGTAGLLELQCAANDEVLTGLARIRRATDIARNLVTGLGSLGELGMPKAKREEHDLRGLLVQGRELLGIDRTEKHAVTVSLPDHARSVWANPTELLQVVVNLALNACEAGPPGINRVTLEVLDTTDGLPERSPDIGTLRTDAVYSGFSVSDTGSGVDPEVRCRMFDRYFTTKGSAGTGLGLPIVAGILAGNDAAMWFDGGPGKGSIFTVAWPASGGHRAPDVRSRSGQSGNSDLTGLNILVVDDVADLADVIAEMLEAAGAVTVAVSDPSEAQLLLEENPGVWSALVTDFHMPGINGAQLAMLAGRQSPRVPTVLVTALPHVASHHASVFDAILPKPTDAARLVEAITSVTSVTQGKALTS